MKRTLKYNLAVTAALYLVVYLGYSFVVFEFKNPFLWFLNIPTYDSGDRFGILFGWIFYWAISIIVTHGTLQERDRAKMKRECKHERKEHYVGTKFKCLDCETIIEKTW